MIMGSIGWRSRILTVLLILSYSPKITLSLSIASSRHASSRQSSVTLASHVRSTTPIDEAPASSLERAYSVKVSYEGISREILVRPNESILNAMERLNVAQDVGLPDLPSDCRRGCCLSCSSRHLEDSMTSHLYQETDGLSPHLSKEMAAGGFVLTCSSFVRGEGVHLSLAHNSEAWHAMYHTRIFSEEMQLSGREAMARVIRQNAERNIDKWIDETEQVLQKPL
jgi:hypothetical protein